MTLHEVDDAAKAIREEVDADANIILFDPPDFRWKVQSVSV